MTTFVLVHGAFRGAWSWDRVAAGLRRLGHDVVTPTLTGMGERASLLSPADNLDTYAADICEPLQRLDLRGVTLVCHSFGGYPATLAADREWSRIDRLVYLDAGVPTQGQSAASVSAQAALRWVTSVAEDGWTIPPVDVSALEVNEGDREMLRGRLTPMPITPFLQRVLLSGGVDRIPVREMVVATGWETSPYRAQAETLAARGGWSVSTVGTGHEVMLDDPDWVVEYLGRQQPPRDE